MNSESNKVVTRVVTNKKSESEASVKKVELEEVAEKVVEKDKSFKERAAEASATVALKAAIEANSAVALNTAEKTYSIEKRRHMLTRCKNDKEVPFVGQKIFAQYFGKTYTFTYNCIPVTVYFDGTERYYPEFIVKKIQQKISRVSESNTYKESIETW